MKHNLLLLIAMITAVCLPEEAQGTQYLTINYKSSKAPAVIALVNEPVITFLGDTLIVNETATGTVYEIPLAEIEDIPMNTSSTDINDPCLASRGKIVAGHINMDGLAPEATVSIYSISGVLAGTYKADAKGQLDIDIYSLKSGIYIIKTPLGSIKVKR